MIKDQQTKNANQNGLLMNSDWERENEKTVHYVWNLYQIWWFMLKTAANWFFERDHESYQVEKKQ